MLVENCTLILRTSKKLFISFPFFVLLECECTTLYCAIYHNILFYIFFPGKKYQASLNWTHSHQSLNNCCCSSDVKKLLFHQFNSPKTSELPLHFLSKCGSGERENKNGFCYTHTAIHIDTHTTRARHNNIMLTDKSQITRIREKKYEVLTQPLRNYGVASMHFLLHFLCSLIHIKFCIVLCWVSECVCTLKMMITIMILLFVPGEKFQEFCSGTRNTTEGKIHIRLLKQRNNL